MAVRITDVFENHPALFDDEMMKLIRQRKSPFDFPGLSLVKSVDESKAINHIKGTSVIIAGSGMCTGGRIKHHLVTNISRPESTILFVGYQAVGTLGRQILDGAKEVRIFGQQRTVKSKTTQISGFSAHADKDELLQWLSGLKRSPKHVFVTHGEPESAKKFAQHLEDEKGWRVSVPNYQDEVVLD
jgi:metallo-beta-lactamase family protein